MVMQKFSRLLPKSAENSFAQCYEEKSSAPYRKVNDFERFLASQKICIGYGEYW
jgi:hypothetical protein